MGPAIEFGAEAALPVEDAVLTAAVLGAGLPEAAERHLRLAADHYRDGDIAEAHLWQARTAAPDHPAVLIGLYRFYFYKNRLAEALSIARVCVEKAAKDNGLAPDWRDVRPADAAFGDFEAVLPRFYLFALKGYAYLNMRLGDLDEGQAAVAKLLELDPSDKIGAKVLLGVLDRRGLDDDA
jgi:tetratricopeptide (TPR) repeat protein